MPVDPQIAVILESLNVTASLDLSTVSPALMRQMFEQPDEARDRGGPELVHQLVRYDGMVHDSCEWATPSIERRKPSPS